MSVDTIRGSFVDHLHVPARSARDAPSAVMSRVPITSLLSPDEPAVHKFRENGRDYYRYGDYLYLFPIDDSEAERLDIMHLMLYQTALKKTLHMARLENPRRILDIGFGTGYWMLEMARTYPYAEIIGYDLVQPSGPPPVGLDRCRFQTPVDFNAPSLPVQANSVDFVHMAQLLGSVSDWRGLYRKAMTCLRPQYGQIEHIEIDWEPKWYATPEVSEAVALFNWWMWIKEASTRAGRSMECPSRVEETLEIMGFADVSHKRIKIPIFTQGKRDPYEWALAHNYQTAMGYIGSNSFESFSMALLTKYCAWSAEQVQDMCKQALETIGKRNLPIYIEMHVWTGRKPLT